MDILSAKLGEEAVFGSSKLAYLIGIRESHPYEEGRPKQDVVDGYKLDCIAPDNKYERITVHVQTKPPVSQDQIDKSADPITVTFTDFSAKIYRDFRKNTYAISARAKAVIVKN